MTDTKNLLKELKAEKTSAFFKTMQDLGTLIEFPCKDGNGSAADGASAAMDIARQNLDGYTCFCLAHTNIPVGQTFEDGVKSVMYGLLIVTVNTEGKSAVRAKNENIKTRDYTPAFATVLSELTRTLEAPSDINSTRSANNGIDDVIDIAILHLDSFEWDLYKDMLAFYKDDLRGPSYYDGVRYARDVMSRLYEIKRTIGC